MVMNMGYGAIGIDILVLEVNMGMMMTKKSSFESN
jgi:hypothetical protein